jgi:hypothetical protein
MVTLSTGNALAFAGCAGGCQGPNAQGQLFSQVGPSAEIYDPNSNAWTSVAMLNTARGNFGYGNFLQSAARLIDGRVLACNGSNGFSTPYDTCEIYDPVANQWSNTASIGETVPTQFVVLLSGLVLAVENDGLGSLFFDPVSSSWIPTGSLISPQPGATLTLLRDGTVLASGGINNSASVPSVEIYNPTTGTWAATGQMNAARYAHIGVLLDDGRVLVAGGQDQNGNILSSAEIYDPSSGTWTQTGSMSQGRVAASAVGLPAASAGTGAVAGQVTNVDGSAAPNILVTILTIDSSGVSARSARTDSVGNYIFGDVPINKAFTVRAYTPDGGSFIDSASTTLSINGQQAIVNLTLPALATVQVTVLQANGSPFDGAQIDIQTRSNQFFRPVGGTTNSNGILNIPNVPQGSFTVEALVPPALTLIGTVSGTVTVGDQGHTLYVTIADPGTTVTGTVVDVNGNPVGGATVTINGGPTGTTLNDGTFSISNAPTVSGNIVATATATINGVFVLGISVPVPPVRGGVTNVGTIVVTACTGVIYENGPVNGTYNAYTIDYGFIVSNSFVPSSSSLRNFDFYAWESSPGDQMLAVQWSITDSPNAGTVYGSGIVASPNLTDTFLFPNGYGYSVDKISASGLNVGLTPGSTYYLNLQNATMASGNAAYWDANFGAGCQSAGCPSQAFSSGLYGSIPSEAFDVACRQQ